MPYASVSITNTTVAVIVAAGRSDERVRLTSLCLTSNATATLVFSTSTGNTAISGTMTLATGTPLVLPAAPARPNGRRDGYMQTNAGDALQITLGTANTRVDGFVEYYYTAE